MQQPGAFTLSAGFFFFLSLGCGQSPTSLTLIPYTHLITENSKGCPHQFNVRITRDEESLAGLEVLPSVGVPPP